MAHAMGETELKEIYAFALDLGRRAGRILLDGVERRTGELGGRDMGTVEEKMNAVDIVCCFPSLSMFGVWTNKRLQVTQADLGISSLSELIALHPKDERRES